MTGRSAMPPDAATPVPPAEEALCTRAAAWFGELRDRQRVTEHLACQRFAVGGGIDLAVAHRQLRAALAGDELRQPLAERRRQQQFVVGAGMTPAQTPGVVLLFMAQRKPPLKRKVVERVAPRRGNRRGNISRRRRNGGASAEQGDHAEPPNSAPEAR